MPALVSVNEDPFDVGDMLAICIKYMYISLNVISFDEWRFMQLHIIKYFTSGSSKSKHCLTGSFLFYA